jgi:hypothetical protein
VRATRKMFLPISVLREETWRRQLKIHCTREWREQQRRWSKQAGRLSDRARSCSKKKRCCPREPVPQLILSEIALNSEWIGYVSNTSVDDNDKLEPAKRGSCCIIIIIMYTPVTQHSRCMALTGSFTAWESRACIVFEKSWKK